MSLAFLRGLGRKKKEVVQPSDWSTISSTEPFTIATYNSKKNWDGALYYSTDTATWSEWDGTVAIASAEHDGEQRVYMSGSSNKIITGANDSNYRWVLTGSNIACNGNIESLLDYKTVANGEHPVMGNYCYSNMFSGCTSLTTAPELPATTLASRCYFSMFEGCTALTTAPALPATTLAEYCCAYMFEGCTALTTAPELPATTLADKCYSSMFMGCTSIKISKTQSDEYPNAYRIPTDGTGNTASDALYYMFYNTGGTFTGTPSINTTYYTANEVV